MAEEITTEGAPEQVIPANVEAAPTPDGKKPAADAKAPGINSINQMLADMQAAEKENYVRDKLKLDGEDVGDESATVTDPPQFQQTDHTGGNAITTPTDYNRQARLLVLFIDTAAGYTLNAYAGGPSMSHYQASESEKNEMAQALAEGMAQEGVSFHIPWWVSFLFVAVIAYWPKFKEARTKHREFQDAGEVIENPAAHWQKAREEAERQAKQQQQTAPPAAMTVVHAPPPQNWTQPAPRAPKPPKEKKLPKREQPNGLTCQLIGCENELKGRSTKYCSAEHRLLGLNGHVLPAQRAEKAAAQAPEPQITDAIEVD